MSTTQKLDKKESGRQIFLTNAISPNMFSQNEVNIHMKKVDANEAKLLIEGKTPVSYIGHVGTAQALGALLSINVPVNRAQLRIDDGEMLIFTLNKRLAEGEVISSVEEINKIGYTLWYVTVKS